MSVPVKTNVPDNGSQLCVIAFVSVNSSVSSVLLKLPLIFTAAPARLTLSISDKVNVLLIAPGTVFSIYTSGPASTVDITGTSLTGFMTISRDSALLSETPSLTVISTVLVPAEGFSLVFS